MGLTSSGTSLKDVRPSGRVSVAEAAEIVAGRDHLLADLIAQAGPMRTWPLRNSTHLAALVVV